MLFVILVVRVSEIDRRQIPLVSFEGACGQSIPPLTALTSSAAVLVE
ncbi:MAG TPA: hypothetical protein VGO61_04800 [Steroidobacteraceae bacterium]|nr:hypothetical protein [Steroidobacteraceae bacterium]